VPAKGKVRSTLSIRSGRSKKGTKGGRAKEAAGPSAPKEVTAGGSDPNVVTGGRVSKETPEGRGSKEMPGGSDPGGRRSKEETPEMDPLKPGGVGIISYPDQEANRERKRSLIPDETEALLEAKKEVVFDEPVTVKDFIIVDIVLLIAGLIVFLIIIVWVKTSKSIKWDSETYGSANYEKLYD